MILLEEVTAEPKFAWMSTATYAHGSDEESEEESERGSRSESEVESEEESEDDVGEKEEEDDATGDALSKVGDSDAVLTNKDTDSADGLQEQGGSDRQSIEDDSDEDYDERGLDDDDFVNDPDFAESDAPGDEIYFAQFESLLGEGTVQMIQLVLGKMGAGGRLDHCIYAAVRESFIVDGSLPNNCIRSLSDGETTMWGGSIVIYGTPKALNSSSTVDLDTNDLTLAINGLVKYEKLERNYSAYVSQPKPLKKVTGVKVSKAEGLDENGRTIWGFEEVRVPVKHPVFFMGAPSPQELYAGARPLTWLCGAPGDGGSFKAKHISDLNPAGLVHVNLSEIRGNIATLPAHCSTDRDTLIVLGNKDSLDKESTENFCRSAVKNFHAVSLDAR